MKFVRRIFLSLAVILSIISLFNTQLIRDLPVNIYLFRSLLPLKSQKNSLYKILLNLLNKMNSFKQILT